MKDQLFTHQIELAERVRFLEDNCDKVVKQYTYTRRLSEEELQALAVEMGENAVQLEAIEDRKKEALAQFKEEMEPHKMRNKTILNSLRSKVEEERGTVCQFRDFDTEKVYTYNSRGEKIEERRLRPDERQTTIMHKIWEGTNG